MKKIMVVDDELDILYGFQLMLDWEALGYEIMALCLDGYEAVEIIEKEAPDIIITDIRMSGMNGLELSEYVAEHYPQIKIIILSSYSEYGYMKTAIDLRVSSYLLKPTDEAQLKKALHKAVKEIEATEQHRLQIESDSTHISGAVLFAACSKLISGDRLEEYERKLLSEKLAVHKPRMFLAQEDIPQFARDEYDGRSDLFYKTLSIGIRNRATLLYSRYIDGRALFVFSTADYDQLLEELRQFCGRNFSETFSAVISEAIVEPEQILSVYTAMKAQLKHEMFFGTAGSYYFTEDVKSIAASHSQPAQIPIGDYKVQLEKAIASFTESRVDEFFSGMLAEICAMKYRLSEQQARKLFTQLGDHALKVLEKEVQLSTSEIEEFRFHLVMLYRLSSLAVMAEKISNLIAELMQSVGRGVNHLGILHPVIDYLKNNYAQPISLDSVAKQFYLNASYLSRIFTKTMGVTFTAYLTDIRLGAARKMLEESDLSISEIARACGYNTEPAFYSTFKKTVGCSPGEYRKTRRR